jgi:uncharacterized protein YuzE
VLKDARRAEMRFRYDREADALSIDLLDEPVSRTEQVDDGTLVDLDRFGHVVSIEVLHPARSWPVEQIADRFAIDEESMHMLRSLWGETEARQRPYPSIPEPVGG